MNLSLRLFLKNEGYADHIVDGGLEGILTEWEKVAQSVASGYELTSDDYLNDLDVRYILDEVLPVLSPRDRDEISQRIENADNLFRNNSVESSMCLWGPKNEQKEGYSREKNWYYYREPKVCNKENWGGHNWST